jgi:hypothetical protein
MSVYVMANDDIVAVAYKAQPGDPETAIGGRRHSGQVILPELVTHHGGGHYAAAR